MADTPGTSLSARIVLVGFMGAGKTTVGRELAKQLGWKFVDVDEEIERLERRTVQHIFAFDGEQKFREMERDQLDLILRHDSLKKVVAVGGGAFVQPGCAELIRQHKAVALLLDAPIETLRKRVQPGSGNRPLAKDPELFAQLYEERKQAYERADYRFETGGKSVERVAKEIVAWVRTEGSKTI